MVLPNQLEIFDRVNVDGAAELAKIIAFPWRSVPPLSSKTLIFGLPFRFGEYALARGTSCTTVVAMGR